MATSPPYDVGSNANELYDILIQNEDINIPPIDPNDPAFQIPEEGPDSPLNKPVTTITNCDLTTGSVDGTGTFDILMQAVKAHLDIERKNQAITGSDYATALISLTEAAMSNAVQFLINRDQAYWGAVMAKYQAQTARIGLFTARAELMRAHFGALFEKSQFTLNKVKALNEGVDTQSKKYIYDNNMPIENAILELQKTGQETSNMILVTQNLSGEFQLDNILPQQYELLKEQTEVQRAQTVDKRGDGATVTGAIGVQKDLHRQQITSYQRDAELKAARMFSDAWITQKTIDEGLPPPSAFANPSVDAVMQTVKTNNNL